MQRKQPDAYPAKYRLMHKNGVIHQKRSSSCNRLLLLAVSQFPIVTSRGSVAETVVLKEFGDGLRRATATQVLGAREQTKDHLAHTSGN